MIVLALLVAYPIVYTGFLSVTDNQAPMSPEEFRRHGRRASDEAAVWNTLYYVLGSIILQVTLGTLVGILLNQKFRGRGIVRAVALIPGRAGIVAATLAWMFHTEFGIINYMLTRRTRQARVGWLTDRDKVMPAMIAINAWKLFPSSP